MKGTVQTGPPTLGLFEKRLEGDDALLELARLRFQQAGMGAEMHASTPDQLKQVLQFRPSAEAPVVVHLARDIHLPDETSRQRILEFAARFAGRILGLVVHDHRDVAARPEDYLRAAQELDSRLQRIEYSPMLFIEYAAGLEPGVFARFIESIRPLPRISACIDTGHVGIREARSAYARIHPGEDLCALKSQGSRLPQVMADVEAAVNSALPAVLNLVEALGACGKPVHFHLHDGHPFSKASPFGVADHLSFLAEIPLGFKHRGRMSVPPMFGADGLARIVGGALRDIGEAKVSFTLEIHPTFGRLPLDDAAPLFGHWRDKTNAEKMNHWLSELAGNHRRLREAIPAASPGGGQPA